MQALNSAESEVPWDIHVEKYVMELDKRRIYTLEVCQQMVGDESHGSKCGNKGNRKRMKSKGALRRLTVRHGEQARKETPLVNSLKNNSKVKLILNAAKAQKLFL